MLIERDKQLHLAAGAIAAFVVGLFFGVPLALVAALVAGVGKEIYDYFNREKHTPELLDAIFTFGGGMVGAWLAEFVK